jgi:hypothetical protein
MQAWHIIGLICLVVGVLGLRLGYKTATLTETDIIDHFTGAYLDEMLRQGEVADSSDCYAVPETGIYRRMRVVCERGDSRFNYVVGYWGQVILAHRVEAQ